MTEHHAQTATCSHTPLSLANGTAAPFDSLPVFSFRQFGHWLATSLRGGMRVSSFFALPKEVAPWTGQIPDKARHNEGSHLLVAVLCDDSHSLLHMAGAVTGRSYPSFTPSLPQLHLFEREIYEQYGITPEGHPWLKPVRFEKPGGPPVGIMDFYQVEGNEVHEVAVGPIHAGVIECGHFRFQCLGEIVMHLEISLGYHHRGVEALLEGGPHSRTLPLMEVTAGDSTIAHAWAYCSTLEALADTLPSARGQAIRALALELERLACHTGDIGAIAGDVGFLPTPSYCGRLRGDWLNMSALLCGSRFGRGLVVPGGCAFDMDAALLEQLEKRLTATARDTEGAIKIMWNAPSVLSRLTGTGPIGAEDAVAVGLVGPAARACGLARDVRHSHPMPMLPLPPDCVVAKKGDARARTEIRHREITASVAFCTRLINKFLEPGENTQSAARQKSPQPQPGRIAVSLVEGWRGEICHVAITDHDGTFAAYKIIDPSFHNWMGLALSLRNQQISDFPLCNKSYNLSYCGHDL